MQFRESREAAAAVAALLTNPSTSADGTLDISGQRLKSIRGLSTDDAASVRVLDLSGNVVERADCLAQFTNVVEVRLERNQLSSIPSQLAQLSQVTFLDISHNRLTAIDGRVLSRMRSLRELRLSGNGITTLKGLVCRELRVLELSTNRLGTLPDLSGCDALEQLDVNGNNISSLRVCGDVLPVRSLTLIDLSRNKIAVLCELAHLSSLARLEHLTVAENPFHITAQRLGFRTTPFLLFACPLLMTVDGSVISEKEREEGRLLFTALDDAFSGDSRPSKDMLQLLRPQKDRYLKRHLVERCPIATSHHHHHHHHQSRVLATETRTTTEKKKKEEEEKEEDCGDGSERVRRSVRKIKRYLRARDSTINQQLTELQHEVAQLRAICSTQQTTIEGLRTSLERAELDARARELAVKWLWAEVRSLRDGGTAPSRDGDASQSFSGLPETGVEEEEEEEEEVKVGGSTVFFSKVLLDIHGAENLKINHTTHEQADNNNSNDDETPQPYALVSFQGATGTTEVGGDAVAPVWETSLCFDVESDGEDGEGEQSLYSLAQRQVSIAVGYVIGDEEVPANGRIPDNRLIGDTGFDIQTLQHHNRVALSLDLAPSQLSSEDKVTLPRRLSGENMQQRASPPVVGCVRLHALWLNDLGSIEQLDPAVNKLMVDVIEARVSQEFVTSAVVSLCFDEAVAVTEPGALDRATGTIPFDYSFTFDVTNGNEEEDEALEGTVNRCGESDAFIGWFQVPLTLLRDSKARSMWVPIKDESGVSLGSVHLSMIWLHRPTGKKQ